MRTIFRDAVAFVHQFVLGATFVRECSPQYASSLRHLPSQNHSGTGAGGEPIAFEMIIAAGNATARSPSERRAMPAPGGDPQSVSGACPPGVPMPPAGPIAVTLAGPDRGFRRHALARAPERLETRTYANDSGPAAADGHHIITGWVARVPVTLVPTEPWDIGGNRYPLHVTATYYVVGDNQIRTLSARAAIDAQVSSAIYEMAAASGILPLICLGAAVTRWRRTR